MFCCGVYCEKKEREEEALRRCALQVCGWMDVYVCIEEYVDIYMYVYIVDCRR